MLTLRDKIKYSSWSADCMASIPPCTRIAPFGGDHNRSHSKFSSGPTEKPRKTFKSCPIPGHLRSLSPAKQDDWCEGMRCSVFVAHFCLLCLDTLTKCFFSTPTDDFFFRYHSLCSFLQWNWTLKSQFIWSDWEIIIWGHALSPKNLKFINDRVEQLHLMDGCICSPGRLGLRYLKPPNRFKRNGKKNPNHK